MLIIWTPSNTAVSPARRSAERAGPSARGGDAAPLSHLRPPPSADIREFNFNFPAFHLLNQSDNARITPPASPLFIRLDNRFINARRSPASRPRLFQRRFNGISYFPALGKIKVHDNTLPCPIFFILEVVSFKMSPSLSFICRVGDTARTCRREPRPPAFSGAPRTRPAAVGRSTPFTRDIKRTNACSSWARGRRRLRNSVALIVSDYEASLQGDPFADSEPPLTRPTGERCEVRLVFAETLPEVGGRRGPVCRSQSTALNCPGAGVLPV